MKIDLIPFMSVLVTEDDFLAATPELLQTPVVNVLGNDGQLYTYSRFSLARYMMTAGVKTPLSNGRPSLLREELQPLANGVKIPGDMLTKILSFFKSVMKQISTSGTGHGEYEAMAHVVWNTHNQAYRIAIPQQKVAKASVTYTWDHIDPDYETVIFDIHSHNTMGAFFSGTDESDDRSYIGISGVAGQLNNSTPALIWRFNAFKTKVPLTAADIFDEVQVQEDPELTAWMGKVEVYTPPVTPYKYAPAGATPKPASVYGVAKDRVLTEDRNSIDEDFSSVFEKNDFRNQGLDDIAEDLADQVWHESDEELNAEVVAVLAGRVADTAVLHDAGVFFVTNSTEARLAIERLREDYTIGN